MRLVRRVVAVVTLGYLLGCGAGPTAPKAVSPPIDGITPLPTPGPSPAATPTPDPCRGHPKGNCTE
jgi:hypothetical protein